MELSMLKLDLNTGELSGEDISDIKYEGNPYEDVEPGMSFIQPKDQNKQEERKK